MEFHRKDICFMFGLLLLLYSVLFDRLVCCKLGVKQASSLTAGDGIRRCVISSLVTLSDVMFPMILIFVLFDFL